MKTMLLTFIGTVCTMEAADHLVRENEVMGITDQQSLEQNSTFVNVRRVDNALILRSSKGEGSLINMKDEVTTDNWSTEFQIKNLVLKDVEKAGIYLWYLDKPLEKGKYKGGSEVFNGFITGIEFSKDRADLVFAFNYGLNFENKDLQTMRFDHINPNLIEHLDVFKIKVIHTEKNFKIELYDDKNQLISDSFRIHEPLIMNRGNHGKNFAITTKYEHCPSEVFLELKDLKINTREETEKYDVRDMHSEYNQHPRNKGDEEIRMAIADMNHFMNYLTIVLGSKNNNNIVEMVLSIKKKLINLRDTLDSITGTHIGNPSPVYMPEQGILNEKLDDLQNLAENLSSKIDGVIGKLKKIQKIQHGGGVAVPIWAFVLVTMVSVGCALRMLSEKIFTVEKTGKKE